MDFNYTNTDLGDHTLYTESSPVSIEITNSGTEVVDAYVSVENDGSVEAASVLLSTSYSGVYVGINDCLVVGQGGDYNFLKGSFSNTGIKSGTGFVRLSSADTPGYYISPIVSLADSYEFSNVVFNFNTVISGVNSLKFYYRASNENPKPLEYVYQQNTVKYDVLADENITTTTWGINPAWIVAEGSLLDNGLVCISSTANTLVTADSNGTVLWASGANDAYEFNKKMEITPYGIVYGYNTNESVLVRTDVAFSDIYGYSLGEDFLIDFSADITSSGTIWYLNRYSNSLHRFSAGFVEIGSPVYFELPTALCANPDGKSCWVVEYFDDTAYRVNGDPSTPAIESRVYLGVYVEKIYSDGNNGFWYISNSYIIHVNSAGIEKLRVLIPGVLDLVMTPSANILACAKDSKYTYIINKDTGKIINRVFNTTSYSTVPGYLFKAFSEDNADNQYRFPLSRDLEWGEVSNLDWTEIDSGFYLPEFKYCQFKVEFSTNNAAYSPELINIKIFKGVKFENVAPQQVIQPHVKINASAFLDVGDYDVTLKCIWKNS